MVLSLGNPKNVIVNHGMLMIEVGANILGEVLVFFTQPNFTQFLSESSTNLQGQK